MPNLPAFLSYVVVTTFTPGPNNILSMANASRYGLKRSMSFILGVYIGFWTVLELAVFFGAALYGLLPSIKPVMTVLGAIYILWLAWKTLKSKPVGEGAGEKTTNTFLAGFLLQFINPKVLLYALTTSTTFIAPYFTSGLVLAAIGTGLGLVGLLSMLSWALFGSVFRKFLTARYKTVNAVMALLLVYCAVALFL